MIEKIKRPQQFNNQEMQIPRNIQELMQRYDLDNNDIRDYLDNIANILNEEKKKNNPLTIYTKDDVWIVNRNVLNLNLNHIYAGQESDFLKLENGGIKCLKDGLVEAKGMIMYGFCESLGVGRITCTLLRNNDMCYTESIPFTNQYTSVSTSGIIEVSEGDIIYLRAENQDLDVYIHLHMVPEVTNLSVKYV